MTAEETRIIILVAQALGWTDVDHGVGPNRHLVLGNEPMRDSSGKIYGYSVDRQPPSYTSDLNACAEFEVTLGDHEFEKYACELSRLSAGFKMRPWKYSECSVPALVRASALHKCTAYLAVKGRGSE